MTEKYYVVHMNASMARKGSVAHRYFVVLRKNADIAPYGFRGIGVWADSPDGACDEAQLREIHIPWHNIDHIENTIYKPR